MLLKSTVKFGNPVLAMCFGAMVVESVFQRHGFECVVTSCNDSVHMEGSKHYTNEAFDVRSKHLPDAATKLIIFTEIKEALTKDFDFIFENEGTPNEHFHLEYQVKT